MSDHAGPAGSRTTFEIPRVLSRAAQAISRNIGVFAILALLLAGLPHLALTILSQDVFHAWGFEGAVGGQTFATTILTLLTSSLLQAALIHGVARDLNGERADFGDCLATAVRHVLPLIGIGIVTAIGVVLGLLFFIVPGIIFSLMWSVAAPVRVVEGLGVFGAISRSGDLTRNHRWALLLLFILAAIGYALLGSVASASSVFALLSGSPSPFYARMIVGLIVQTASALVGAAGIASVYFELRTVKEGIGPEALAAAFD
jgi:hypothetical protein